MRNLRFLLIVAGTGMISLGIAGSFETFDAVAQSTAPAKYPSFTSIEQMPGFPIEFEYTDLNLAPWNMRGVVLADLDGIDGLEVVYSYQNRFPPRDSEGFVVAWDQFGQLVSGFPVRTVGGAFFAPTIGDIDDDGDQEIVQVTVDDNFLARLYVVEHTGEVRAGFPVVAGYASIADGAALHNLDDDAALEILYVSDRAAHIFEADGSEWTDGWPVPLIASAHGTPAVGDVDHDGQPEIFLTEWNLMHLLDVDGRELEGWPREISGATFAVLSSAAIADLDKDDDLEIVVPACSTDTDGESITKMYVLHHDGTLFPGWPQTGRIEATECPPVITDLEGDGELEILIGSELITRLQDPPVTLYTAQVFAWDAGGNNKPGFPWTASDFSSDVTLITASDMDGDGAMEIFADAAGTEAGRGYVFGLNATGQELQGFPLRPIGESMLNGAILGDVDRDGDLELGAVSFLSYGAVMTLHINLYDLEGGYRPSNVDWPTFHAANERGGQHKRRYRGWRVVYTDRMQ